MPDAPREIILRDPLAVTPAVPVLSQEEQLVELWLHGLSRHTKRAYKSDWRLFRRFAPGPIRSITLTDLQSFVDHLESLALGAGSRHRAISGIKSFFGFAARLGALPVDIAQPLRMSAGKDTLNERILTEAEVAALIGAAESPRNRAIVELLYYAGLRVSELVGLEWKDAIARKSGGQVTVFGKGRKTRSVLVPESTWRAMLAQRAFAADASPVFASGRGRGEHLSASQVGRIVRDCAIRAGIAKPVSPHWLRHCHCSHALDNGAPLHVIQATAGHSSVATTSRYLHARPEESSSTYLPRIPPPAPI